MNKETRAVYNDVEEIGSYKEMLKRVETKFSSNIAYKYKKDYTQKEPEYIEKTYQETLNDIKALGTKLLDLNLKGKKAIIIGRNSYAWCVSYFAITTSGMIVAPLDVALPSNEIETLVKRSGAEVIIFDKKFADLAKQMKKGKTKLKTLICMQDIEDKEITTFNKMLEQGNKLIEKGNNEYEKVEVDPEKMSIMLFTSGTTNLPKIVMLSQKNICSDISGLAKVVRIYDTDTLLSFLPLHHTFESTVTFLYGFYSGATVAFCDGLRYIQKNLQEYKISVFVAVPLVLETMYKKIQKAIEEQGKTKLINALTKVSNGLLKINIDIRKKLFKKVLDSLGGNIRIMLYGAAPMSKETVIGYTNLGIEQIQGYGLTETSPVVSAETNKEKRPGSIGLPLPGLKVKIVDKNEEGIGEIVVKGPTVMLGYYENEEETKKAIKDGWFYTGDYGYLDKDGFLFITGRKKDIIVLQNGKNVYPQEIEFLINKFPGVIESLVYQRKKDTTDTMLCAKIIYDKEMLKQLKGEKTEEEYKEMFWEQIKEMNKGLPIYKKIKNITLSTEELAKTTTHKIKRYEELKKVD